MTNQELNTKENEALQHIRNHFNTYAKMPSVRQLMEMMGYQSPRSGSQMFERLEQKGILEKQDNGKFAFSVHASDIAPANETVDVPLVGTTSCGGPMFAEENIEDYYRISTRLAPFHYKHFFLRVRGDSMNQKGINPGDLVLIRQQDHAKNGDLVLALIDDEATIKQYEARDGVVLLRPCSNNPIHKPIILTEDFRIQGIVIKSLPNL